MHFDVGSGIRAFRLVLIGALLVVASAPAATAATAGFGSPAPGRPVLQWMPEEFATGHTYTQAQAVTAATRYDVIVAYTQAFQPYVAAMRAANPNLVLLAYMNGMFVPPAQATSWPADWYSYDANGIKVQNAQNKNYLMNPSNSGWVQNRATMCANLVAQSGYDGCMLDTLGVAPLTPGYCTALPINPATGAAWARPDWISATTQLSQSVRTTISPSLVVGNGLKDGPSLGESSQLFNGMDGGIAEGFLRTSTQSATTYPSVSTWQQNVNMLLSPPKPVLALTKVWASATADQLNQWHLYALASFLLGTDGRSYFYFSSASSEPPISVVPWSVNIGDPSGAYALQDGAYQRPFTQGRVLVNPTASQVSVPLSGAYAEMDGTQVSGSLVMPPNTGQILQATSASVPGAPTGVSATAGNASATVSFSAPVSDGGSAITGYTVTAADATTPANGGQSKAGSASPVTVTGLTNGDAYTFTVTATNGVGTGPASAPSNSVTPSAPASVPGAPTGVSAVGGNASAVVSFSAPVSDGGSAITGYTVTAADATTPGNGGQTKAGGASPVTVTGLTNGDAYTFTVTATNGVGTGPASAPSNSVTPSAPASVPGAPTGVSATAGNASAAVSFSAPVSDGGSAITGYTVTAADATTPGNGGQTKAGSASPVTVTGLTNGDAYTFTVTATNGVGTGPASAPSNSVTPTGSALLTLTTPAPAFGVVSVAYSYQLNATGGKPPYTWAVTSGSLPPGLHLASTGAISGTPTAAGSWTFGIVVRDASTPANSLTSALTIQIYPKAKNGSGTETISPATATHGSSGNTFTLTYSAPATGALYDGKLKITVPSGWTAPSKTSTSPGLVATSMGSISISGQTITISGLRLAPGAAFTVTYGSTAGGKKGVTIPSSTGAYTFTTKQGSASGANPVPLASSPTVTVG